MSDKDGVFREAIPEGFIRDFVDGVKQRIPNVNTDYLVACAESLLSSVCYNISLQDDIGALHLGLWNLGITESGEYKTVPIKYYVKPILHEVQKTIKPTGNIHRSIVVPSKFSPESLIEFMRVHKETSHNPETGDEEDILVIRNQGLMVRDEFTSMMKGTKNKTWMTDVSETLSEVYDNSVQPYYTKKDGFQDVPYCNVAFLMATTPLIYRIMDESFFTQGLGNRIDPLPFDPPEEAKEINPDVFFSYKRIGEREVLINTLSRQLVSLLKSKIRHIGIKMQDDEKGTSPAKMWTEYQYEIEYRKRQLAETRTRHLRWSFLCRQADKALRRAAIYSISRNLKHKSSLVGSELDTFIIETVDMSLAIKRQRVLHNYFERFLIRWLKSAKSTGGTKTDIVDLEYMMGILLDTTDKMISNQQWCRRAGYGLKNKYYHLKASLVNSGEIRILTEEETYALSNQQRKRLELTHGNQSVYRPTDSYFERNGLPNPFEKGVKTR